MSSKHNSTIISDPQTLSQEDLVEIYQKLAENYTKIKEENEKCHQDLYSSKQTIKILTNSQNDLQNELDNINSAHQEEIDEILRRNSSTIESLKQSKHEVEAENSQLESRLEALVMEVENYKSRCDELKEKLANQKPAPRISDSFSINLEVEIESLQSMLHELKAKLIETEEHGLMKDREIEELKEKILCLEDNIESKKSELEEKNDAIEALQENIQEMTMELAMLKTAPEDGNRKGNSLFAEVDDQRQKMKIILKSERDHFMDMKKSINAKEIEIRRLKRENRNIKTEIQACSSLLRRGEQIAIQTMTAQVTQLVNDNKKLEQVLNETEKKLIDLAKEQNLGWIESLMSSGNYENRDLKDKLMKEMMEKSLLADNFNKIQKELVKARLDCVKLKILLGRIVDVNGIKIHESDFADIGVDEEILENLKVEEFEVESEQEALDAGELNESTIVLLGGRERLGHAVPKLIEEKENLPPAEKSPLKPLQNLQETHEEETKSVKFSSTVETKVIDNTQENFEQSKKARKRNTVVVKRIVIPSKTASKIPQ